MGILDETRFVERQQFFNGQRLFAPDLQGVEEFNREMRWLHNRSLHQPGIGNGLAVNAEKGDRQVSIGPGYAIDSQGREIVLTHTQVEPIPPVAGDGRGGSAFYSLTISYPEDSELEEAETREGICQTRGVVRLREEPVFCWVRLKFQDNRFTAENVKLRKQIEEGTRLTLARVEIRDCQLLQRPSVAQRRSARPSAQPYIACGETTSGIWNDWVINTDKVGITANVDTSQAGFLTTPCYSARIAGDRVVTIQTGTGDAAVNTTLLVTPVMFISGPNPTGFTLFVKLFVVSLAAATGLSTNVPLTPDKIAALPNLKSDSPNLITDPKGFAQTNEWKVVWMGVED